MVLDLTSLRKAIARADDALDLAASAPPPARHAGRPLSPAEDHALASAFEDSDLPYSVDVVDLATASEAFRRVIERDRIAL